MLKISTLIVAASFGEFVYGTSRPDMGWKGCSTNPSIECGSYQVPLDYADTSVGHATLAVARYRSQREPRLGTIFTNPGGPGVSGTQWIHSNFSELLVNDTNGQYDIVSWDPRGVNLTTPKISCGLSKNEDLAAFMKSSIPGKGIEARGNFTDQKDIDNFYGLVNATDAQLEQFAKLCMNTDGKFLKYMGTTANVRDMVSMADALDGPDKAINYWGFSHGTVTGNYFVNMFPNRVGRVILDGVVDTAVYANEPSYKMWSPNLESVESTFSGFAQTCAQAGPGRCAIAKAESTSASISQWVRDLVDKAYDSNQQGRFDVPNSYAVRSSIYHPLYNPTTWAQLAQDLAVMADKLSNTTSSTAVSQRTADPSPFMNMMRRGASESVFMQQGENRAAFLISAVSLTCLDSIDQNDVTMKDVFDELLRVTHQESPMFGELMPATPAFYCHRFPERAVERFTGPFNHSLSNPILIIGNEADPITPFASAKAVADALGSDAYLIEQADYGHASPAERSDCTRNVIKAYLVKGQLPEKSKFCGTDQVIFPGPGADA